MKIILPVMQWICLATAIPAQGVQIELFESSGVVSAGASFLDSAGKTDVDEQQRLFGLDGSVAVSGFQSAMARADASNSDGFIETGVNVKWILFNGAIPARENVFADARVVSGLIRISGTQSYSVNVGEFASSSATAQMNLRFTTDGSLVELGSISSTDGSGTTESTSTSASHFVRAVGGPSGDTTVVFSFDKTLLPGASVSVPLPSSISASLPSAESVRDSFITNRAQEVTVQLPDRILDINLNGYTSPIVENGYGNAELTYFGGSFEQILVGSPPNIDRLAEPVHEREQHFTSGFLFLNIGDSRFNTFVLPEELIDDTSQFQLHLNGVLYDLAAGEVFDFTEFTPGGVNSFLLTGINASERTSSAESPPPFTFGMTFSANSRSEFVAVPLITVPEPTCCFLAALPLTLSLCVRRSTRKCY